MATTARVERRVAGVLTDATTVTLSDANGQFGVRRADTGTSVVAAGTATIHAGTGIYEYDYSALDESYPYELSWKIVAPGSDTEYQLQVLVPSVQGFSWIQERVRTLRERVGRLTGLGHFDTATAGAAGTFTCERAKAFADDSWVGYVVYITDGTGFGQSRVVTDHVQSTGVVTISPNWTTNPDTTSRMEVWAKDLSPEVVNNALSLALLQIQQSIPVQVRLNPSALDTTNYDNMTLPPEMVKVYGLMYLDSARVWVQHKMVNSPADLQWGAMDRACALFGNVLYVYPAIPSDRAIGDLYVLGYRHPTTLMAAGELAEGPSAFIVYVASALLEGRLAEGTQNDPEAHSTRAANWLAMARSIPIVPQWEPNTQTVGP
jgi:hypothetical protein